MAGWDADEELKWREARRQLTDLAHHAQTDPYVGWCGGCQAIRSLSQCRSSVSFAGGEVFVWACLACGTTIDELPPF
jgi:hypothetical protein